MRASLWAVAVIAFGAPRWAFFRRRKAPRALLERCSALAARRSALAARLPLALVFELMTRPPVMRLLGLSPNQDAKCLALVPFRHVRANLADDLQRREAVHAVDSGQVHPSHPVQLALDVEAGRVLLIALFAIGSRRLTVAAVFKPLQLGFNLPVALGNPGLIRPVQLQGLGQLEDVLLPPMALQRLGNGRLVGLDPGVAQSRQPARDSVRYDVHAGLAGNIADDVGASRSSGSPSAYAGYGGMRTAPA